MAKRWPQYWQRTWPPSGTAWMFAPQLGHARESKLWRLIVVLVPLCASTIRSCRSGPRRDHADMLPVRSTLASTRSEG
jgi:hypothetical protein